jgi:hypothetical protein
LTRLIKAALIGYSVTMVGLFVTGISSILFSNAIYNDMEAIAMATFGAKVLYHMIWLGIGFAMLVFLLLWVGRLVDGTTKKGRP